MDYENIPKLVMAGMKRYVNEHIKPGEFLTAVIENNLALAVGRADNDSFSALKDIIGWFWNEPTSECWGSPEKMKAWLDKRVI